MSLIVDVVMDSVRIVNTQLSINNISSKSNRELVKIIDLLGRESKLIMNIPLLYLYDNGDVEKIIKQ
ncbi:MAG: hypothetical protein HN564_08175 [Flavobacteriales bacterium]|nr:hypothetical protein [Flavobacteriales bacterium]